MPRTRRISPDNHVHHVLNRGNRRQNIFHETADYEDFFNLLADAQERVAMRILGVCVMTNHFHIVCWPEKGESLSAYMTWFMNAQIRRHQNRHGTVGLGHIYQGRYRNFLVQNDAHLYRVLRYVEANPLRASMVQRAEQYCWSSLSRPTTPDGRIYLTDWPIPRPVNWVDYVNSGIPNEELHSLRESTRRGAPYGDGIWMESTVRRFGLESTVRSAGRPQNEEVHLIQ